MRTLEAHHDTGQGIGDKLLNAPGRKNSCTSKLRPAYARRAIGVKTVLIQPVAHRYIHQENGRTLLFLDGDDMW
jgi:hypothetical protein